MACNDLWIIADHQNHDKIQELFALKNSAAKKPEISAMHIFFNFDVIIHQAQDMGSSLKQLLDGLAILLGKRKRLPHTILLCMGDELLKDRTLMKDFNQVYRVLVTFSKKIVQSISNWTAALPPKAKPDRMPRIYITKPLPVPDKFFQNRQKLFDILVKERKSYITELVRAVKSLHIGFINANLTHEDGNLFERITTSYPRHTEKFILNPNGLRQYWKNISQNLYNLAWDAAATFSRADADANQQKEHKHQERKQATSVYNRLGPVPKKNKDNF